MKRVIMAAVLIIALLSIGVGAFAETWDLGKAAGTLWNLTVNREEVTAGDWSGWYKWTYTLLNGETSTSNHDITIFRVGLVFNDGGIIGNATSPTVGAGHLQGYSGPTNWFVDEDPYYNRIQWRSPIDSSTGRPLYPLMGGSTAAFSFYTDYEYWSMTNIDNAHTAQNGRTATWLGPTPSVPEPMSMVLGFMGLSSVAGLSRLRRKTA